MALTAEQTQELLRNLPGRPGVYLMLDARSKVIYVGKAKDLRKRVSTYFQEGRPASPKLAAQMKKTAQVDFLVTASEKEALILEATLIKRHRPVFNVILRDDKSYPLIRLSTTEEWPKLSIVRRPRSDGNRCFGPYVSAKAARTTLDLMNHIFPLRKCQGPKPPLRSRPCLHHQMGHCLAPCCLPVPAQVYARLVEEAALFLSGRLNQVVRQMEARMWAAAQGESFEEAAGLRDKLTAIRATLEKQVVVSSQALDRDVFGLAEGPLGLAVAVLFVRQGALTGHRSFFLKGASFRGTHGPTAERMGEIVPEIRAELIGQAVGQFYTGKTVLPDQVLLPAEPADAKILAEWLGEVKGGRVVLMVPKRGRGREMLKRAEANAQTALPVLSGSPEALAEEGLRELSFVLRLPRTLASLECYDISIHQGENPVGAMVRFEAGRPVKAKYRDFKIKTVAGQDDFAMLAEVLKRRFAPEKTNLDPPDLIVIDGGKGQLSVARAALAEVGRAEQPLVSLAKTAGKIDADRLFLPGRKNPANLAKAATFLLMRLRDEAHRRAISALRRARGKKLTRTALLEIPGVGPKRARELLLRFGSVSGVAEASLAELSALPGVSAELARAILAHLEKAGKNP